MKKTLFTLFLLLPLSLQAQNRTDPFATDRALIQKANQARIYGTDTSKVFITEFADFACPDCKVFYQARMDSLKARYITSGKANFIFRPYLILRLMRGFHGAEAAFCAGGLSGKSGFEGMMGKLFNHQDEWRRLLDPRPKINQYAEALKLPLLSFQDCMDRDVMHPLIIQDIEAGNAADIGGTPTLVLTTHLEFNGKHQFDPDVSFKKLDAAIQALEATLRKK